MDDGGRAPAPRRDSLGEVSRATIGNLRDSSTVDAGTGAVRSVQSAELTLPEAALRQMWSPMYMERLARTYWRFLTRVTLGLVRVKYTEGERFVVLLFRPLKLLSFRAPEYEMQPDRGMVRWRVERGLLVARAGRGGRGHLQIEVRRLDADERTPPDGARVSVEVEVENFYPRIAAGLGRWMYRQTQSRIHVLVTNGFLRSLARRDLAESRTGRFRAPTPAAATPPTPAAATPPTPAATASPNPARAAPAKSGPRRRRAAWRGRGGR